MQILAKNKKEEKKLPNDLPARATTTATTTMVVARIEQAQTNLRHAYCYVNEPNQAQSKNKEEEVDEERTHGAGRGKNKVGKEMHHADRKKNSLGAGII
jgi:hypothetical protein